MPPVGFWDWLLGTAPSSVDIAGELKPPYPSVQAQIDAYVNERMAGGPSTLPAVERGVQLIATAVAQLVPVAYRDGAPLEVAPTIVERPDPWSTRYLFLEQTARSMVETGDAFWFLFDHDPDPTSGRRPRRARVLPSSEVEVTWDAHRFLPTYKWRSRPMVAGVDIVHIPLVPRVGELRGRSPLVECETALLTIQAQELYASGWFGGAGVPSGVLTVPGDATDEEADAYKAQWLAAHKGPVPTPAVLSGGVTWTPEAANPEDSQMSESREHGVATIARLLGIPAPLLLVAVSSSSITYANVSQLYAELYRSTVIPLYLAPIEAAWSDIVARTTSVRFDLGELTRLDVASRVAVEHELLDMGVLDAAEIARREGIVAGQTAPALAPAPTPLELPAAPEVPVA
jgi:HK97 family phage portal protein